MNLTDKMGVFDIRNEDATISSVEHLVAVHEPLDETPSVSDMAVGTGISCSTTSNNSESSKMLIQNTEMDPSSPNQQSLNYRGDILTESVKVLGCLSHPI